MNDTITMKITAEDLSEDLTDETLDRDRPTLCCVTASCAHEKQ